MNARQRRVARRRAIYWIAQLEGAMQSAGADHPLYPEACEYRDMQKRRLHQAALLEGKRKRRR